MDEIIWRPEEIEARSFAIIEEALGAEKRAHFTPGQWEVARRAVHSTADLELVDLIRFSQGAVKKGKKALISGTPVITDTSMVLAGISTGRLERLGCEAKCLLRAPQVAQLAAEKGITRSAVGMELALAESPSPPVVVIGNAPTALFRLLELAASGVAAPALVIGAPVGFVGAAESKEALAHSSIPHITISGPKGGSPAAAAILNAIAVMALKEA